MLVWVMVQVGLGLFEDKLSARDTFSGVREAGFLLVWYFCLTFSPTLWYVEGMNALTRGCSLSCSLYRLFLKDKVSLGLTEALCVRLIFAWNCDCSEVNKEFWNGIRNFL